MVLKLWLKLHVNLYSIYALMSVTISVLLRDRNTSSPPQAKDHRITTHWFYNKTELTFKLNRGHRIL